MSGANGVPKFGKVNRESQFDPLQVRGVLFFQRDLVFLGNPATPITPTQFLQDLILTAGGGLYTGPSAAALFAAMSQQSVPEPGNRFSQIIENASNFPITINLGAGFTPAAITIEPFSVVQLEWELHTLTPTFRLFGFEYKIFQGSALPPPTGLTLPPGVVPGDLLEWDGSSWQASSSISSLIPGVIDNITTTAPASLYLNVLSWLRVNEPSARSFPGFPNNDRNPVVDVNVPIFQDWDQAGVRSKMLTFFDPQDPNMLRCANFRSEFGLPLNVPLPDPPGPEEFVYHFIGCTDDLIFGQTLRWGCTVSGNTYALTYNVLSGQDAKKDIESTNIDSRAIRDLQPRLFRYRRQDSSVPKTLGLVAEEVDRVFPGVMTAPKPELDQRGKPKTAHVEGKYMNLAGVVAGLVGIIKDLEARVSRLEE